MTKAEREEQEILLHEAGPDVAGTDVRFEWGYCVYVAGHALDRILESAAYAWTDGPK